MKFISLISSGIDSPVATYLLSKNADEIILVHGDIRPFTDNRENENFKKLAKHLDKITSCKIKVVLIPHADHRQRDRRSRLCRTFANAAAFDASSSTPSL